MDEGGAIVKKAVPKIDHLLLSLSSSPSFQKMSNASSLSSSNGSDVPTMTTMSGGSHLPDGNTTTATTTTTTAPKLVQPAPLGTRLAPDKEAILQRFWETEQDVPYDPKNHSDLPLARIKRVMKADVDVRMVASETPIIFARACQLFIHDITQRGWFEATDNDRKTVLKTDIHDAIGHCDAFDFLVDVANGIVKEEHKQMYDREKKRHHQEQEQERSGKQPSSSSSGRSSNKSSSASSSRASEREEEEMGDEEYNNTVNDEEEDDEGSTSVGRSTKRVSTGSSSSSASASPNGANSSAKRRKTDAASSPSSSTLAASNNGASPPPPPPPR